MSTLLLFYLFTDIIFLINIFFKQVEGFHYSLSSASLQTRLGDGEDVLGGTVVCQSYLRRSQRAQREQSSCAMGYLVYVTTNLRNKVRLVVQ